MKIESLSKMGAEVDKVSASERAEGMGIFSHVDKD